MEIERDILDRLKRSILELDIDFRVEALVSALVKEGIDPDQVIVDFQSIAKRSYRKEVSGFHTETSDYDNREYLFLHTHRDGLYDALPENVFHQPTRGKTEKNKYEVIDEIKKHRVEESQARKFFQPFEYEYNHIRSYLYQIEEDYEKNIDNSKLLKIFSVSWPILKKLDTRHAYIFFRLIPMIHSLRNDFELISQSMTLILGFDVKVSLYNRNLSITLYDQVPLGVSRLGIDTTLGNIVQDGLKDVKVEIGPLNYSLMSEYAAGGKNESLIEELLQYFVGAEYNICKEILVYNDIAEFKLNEGQVLLGANSIL